MVSRNLGDMGNSVTNEYINIFNREYFNYLFNQCGKEFNFRISLDKDICLCVGGDDCICSGSKSTKSTGEILKQANYVLMKDELLSNVLKHLQY